MSETLFRDRIPNRQIPQGVTEREFECRRDNLTIRGYEYRPEGENLPIAIVSHGIMAWLDTTRHYAMEFAELGYAAFCFDFNGGSVSGNKSDGKTTDMTVLTEVQDLEAVINYVRGLRYVDRDRMLLMGCSQGGYVSAIVAAKNKYPIQKLCLFYPALCIPEDARSGKVMRTKVDLNNLPEIIHCGPMALGRQYALDVLDMDAYDIIRQYKGQVLIVHGTADKIVNIEYSKRAAAAYLSTKPENMTDEERIRLDIIEGGEHMFNLNHDREAIKYLDDFARLK